MIKEKLEELGELGKDYFFCSSKFFKEMRKELPSNIKIIDDKKYVVLYNHYIRCVIVDEFVPDKNEKESKPKKQERKNFARDYLMKGKRWLND